MAQDLFRVRVGLTAQNSTAQANLTPLDLNLGGTTIANTIGVYTGVVNATTIQVATDYTANSTVVNAAAVNCRGQLNTATFFATTSANVGANVQLTTVQLFAGNSVANATVNSVMVSVSNATGIANLQPTQLVIGTSKANTTVLAAGANVIANTTGFFKNTSPVLYSHEADQTITGGGIVTSLDLGTKDTGTVTLDMGARPLQHMNANGAFTLAPGSNTGSIHLDIIMGTGAGAITITGWTQSSGDTFTTTASDKFRCHCSVGQQGSLIQIVALQ